MFSAISMLLLSCALATSVSAECIPYFDGPPTDAVFILDVSPEIGKAYFDTDLRGFLENLIIKTMRVGPEFVRLAGVKFEQDGAEKAFDLITNLMEVYESEFLAPGGIFDTQVRYSDVEATDTPNRGMERAIQLAEQLLLNNATDKKVVFLATDAIFSEEESEQLKNVSTAVKSLRNRVTGLSENTTLLVYGIAIGDQYDESTLRTLVDEGNEGQILPGTPNMEPLEEETTQEPPTGNCTTRPLGLFRAVIDGKKYHPAKPVNTGRGGVQRMFHDGALCCVLCAQAGKVDSDQCSMMEFISRSYIPADLECKVLAEGSIPCPAPTTPRIDLCASQPCQNGGTCSRTQTSYLCTCATGYRGTECQHEVEDKSNNSLFSVLLVLFVVMNLLLLVLFIVVAVCSKRLSHSWKNASSTTAAPSTGLPKTPAATQPTQLSRSRPGTFDHPQANTPSTSVQPTRQAPAPPRNLSPPGYDTATRTTPAIVTDNQIPYSYSPQTENIYRNVDSPSDGALTGADDDYEIPEAGGDYQNIDSVPSRDRETAARNPQSYIDLFRHDVTHKAKQFRNSLTRNLSLHPNARPAQAGALSNTVLRSEIPLPGSSNQSFRPQPKPRSVFHNLGQRFRRSRNYENDRELGVQELHDRHTNTDDSELKAKLDRAKRRTEQPNHAFQEEPVETAGTDYVNVEEFTGMDYVNVDDFTGTEYVNVDNFQQ